MDALADERIREFLVARRADQFAFLSALVRAPSENPPGGHGALRDLVTALIDQHELEVELHEVPEADLQGVGFAEASNLVVRRRFGPGPTVALAAHLDTAPAGEGWDVDPCGADVVDGRMYGRGTSDGKGDLAAYLFALLALDGMAEDLAGTIELHLSFDGFSGGAFGPNWLLNSEIVKPDLAIVPGVGRSIGTTSTGVLNMRVEISGKTAPSGEPHIGADALEGTAPVLQALYAHQGALRERRSEIPGIEVPTIVITEISGGSNPLMVPDHVALSIDRRILPEEAADAVEAEITNIIGRSAAHIPGVVCKVRRRRLMNGVDSGESAASFIRLLAQRITTLTGDTPVSFGVSRETAARDYAAHGVPVILYGAGPDYQAPSRATGPNEHLVLDDLRVATEALALALADWLAPGANELNASDDDTGDDTGGDDVDGDAAARGDVQDADTDAEVDNDDADMG